MTKITEMINEHRSNRNVGLSENDKFAYPDSAKGSVTYDLEYSFVDPDTGEEKAAGDGEIVFYLPVTDGHKQVQILNNGTLAVYSGGSYHVALDASAAGFAAYVGILDASAPTAYEFEYELPDGFKLTESDSGNVIIRDADGDSLGMIEAPWAVDAEGNPVQTRYTLRDGVLVQAVDHTDAVYPVVADPWWNLGWQGAKTRLHAPERAWCYASDDNEDVCITAYGHHGTRAMFWTAFYFITWARSDHTDAFRHCLWSARLHIGMSHADASFILDLHEQEPGQPSVERQMDEWNNDVGYSLSNTTSSYATARNTCYSWSRDDDGPLQLSLDD